MCPLQIARLDESSLVHIYLFPSNSCQEVASSVNHQLLTSDLWSPSPPPPAMPPISTLAAGDAPLVTPSDSTAMPPVLDMPQTGHNMDVFVSVACHPGHFVVQPWQELYKLIVLMGEMILYYNRVQDDKTLVVEKNHIYAAKVENKYVEAAKYLHCVCVSSCKVIPIPLCFSSIFGFWVQNHFQKNGVQFVFFSLFKASVCCLG